MKIFISTILIFMLASLCAAQPEPDALWTRTFGGSGIDAGFSVCPTADGNYISAGITQSYGPDDIYLVKLSETGDTLWCRVMDLGNIEQANFVRSTTDGGFVLTGSIQYMDGGSIAMLLVKANGNGDTLWTRAYGSSGSETGYVVQPTPDGGYIIGGATPGENADADVYIVKTNAAGDTLWTHAYPAARNNAVTSVERTSDGGYILAGYTNLPQQATTGFAMKISATGDLLWRREYTGLFNMPVLANQTNDGGYMIAGTGVPSGTLHLGPYLMKTDSLGNSLWMQLHSMNPLDEWMFAAQRTSDGGYIMAGTLGNIDSALYGLQLVRMDSLGGVQWTRLYGSGTGANASGVLETADHGYVAVGNAQTDDNSNDMYVVRTGPEGMVMVAPNGGDSLGIGRSYNIRWNGSIHGGNVAIEINRNFPSVDWTPVIASTPNTGQYAWMVNGPESDRVRFRIHHLTNAALTDTSDADFSIRTPRIQLFWPNGGETLYCGVRDTVRFHLALTTSEMRIELNRNYPNGTWDAVVWNIGDDSTAYWIVQSPAGIHCRLRLISILDSTLGDTSDADFVVRQPQITLTAPNGGEQVPIGVPYTILWSAPEHEGNVRIWLNRDYPNGTWETIATSIPNNGQRSWTPAGAASEHCRIRVSTALDQQSRVESAADFALLAASAQDPSEEIPVFFTLADPYPNPFNARTTLSYSVPVRGEVMLVVHDVNGREVRTLRLGVVERGHHQIQFDASDLPSGMYFYRLQWGGQSLVKKMLLLK
jgi:hypothetical protein